MSLAETVDAPSKTVAPDPERAWYLEDWVNPVLLKEVRQALRGKYFKVCFWITLLAVTVVTTGILVLMGEDGHIDASEGRSFVFGVYFCLAIAALGLVPFSAFSAMGAEWDENTFDLLIISNVRPHGIVLGKLLAAGVQTLLVYSAFTPYLVLASLMQGVDLNAVAVVLGGTLLLSLMLSVFALGLSTLSRVRFARVILQASLAVALFFSMMGSMFAAQAILEEPGVLQERETFYGAISLLVPAIVITAYSFGIAGVMLSHQEENRSTGMRILTTGCLLLALVWIHLMVGFAPSDALWVMGIGTLAALLLPCIFFVTEPERLPRRVTPRVPPSRLLAALATPYLPGGARGFVYFALHVVVLLAGLAFLYARSTGSSVLGGGFAPVGSGGELALLAAVLYGFIYLGLPSAVLAPYTAHPALRSAARALIPFVIGAFAFLPSVLGFFTGDASLMQLRHAGNPLYLMIASLDQSSGRLFGTWFIVVVLAALSLLLNAPRCVRAVHELLEASTARAEREAARAERAAAERAPDAVA